MSIYDPYMYVCMCFCVYVYTGTYMHGHMCVCVSEICMCLCVCVCMHRAMRTQAHVAHVCVCARVIYQKRSPNPVLFHRGGGGRGSPSSPGAMSTPGDIYTGTCVCDMYVCMYVFVCVCMYTPGHTYTGTCVCVLV